MCACVYFVSVWCVHVCLYVCVGEGGVHVWCVGGWEGADCVHVGVGGCVCMCGVLGGGRLVGLYVYVYV